MIAVYTGQKTKEGASAEMAVECLIEDGAQFTVEQVRRCMVAAIDFAQQSRLEELPKKMSDYDYHHIKSNINERWEDLHDVTHDMRQFIVASWDAGGKEHVCDVIRAIESGISQGKQKVNEFKN